jgi:hypothetical protein
METSSMKFALLFCLAGSAVAVMAQTSSAQAKAPASTNAPAEVKIPAGALKTEDGSFKFTDSDGKKWIFRNTPFGVAKSEDKPMDATATPFGKVINPTSASVSGDSQGSRRQISPPVKNCQAGDTSPAGTVVDGYKKVIEQTPFGRACRWIGGN